MDRTTSDRQPTLTQMTWGMGVLLSAFFLSFSAACSRDLSGVAYRFLERHGVPCLSVLKVASTNELAEVATCEDGREWALFWLEDEIGFVDPQSREPYKWDRQTYLVYPELYSRPHANDPYQAVSDIR